ncbi:MAG: HAMP domain-containing protein [Bacteroidetes bacterium]|nr:HAMP domain-containing protein [Bacteroidota bacterium]
MLKNLSQINTSLNNKFGRRLKFLILIAFLLLFWNLASNLTFRLILTSNSNNPDVLTGKNNEKINYILNSFQKLSDETITEARKISSNTEIRKTIQSGENKKVFDEFLKKFPGSPYQIEIYNKPLELIAFEGREISPKTFSLQKALTGKSFSIIKEISFYTYLVVYMPIRDLQDTNTIIGVSTTARLIDNKFQIKNKFITYDGLSSEVEEKYKVTPDIIAADEITGKIINDTVSNKSAVVFDLKGLDGTIIGKIALPEYNQENYFSEINTLNDKINSLTIFLLSLISLVIILELLAKFNSIWLKSACLLVFLVLIRFLWLKIGFPSVLLESDLFSPAYYASTFGKGIVKSAGDLLISSVLGLIWGFYVFQNIFKHYKDNGRKPGNLIWIYFELFLQIIFFFGIIYILGIIVQSVVFDSNLKFLDKTSLIPDAGLIFILISIFLCGITAFIFLTILVVNEFYSVIKFDLITNKIVRKYFLVFLFILFVLVSQLIELMFADFPVSVYQRLLIISSIFLFSYFLCRNILLKREFRIFSYANISLLVLISLISIPYILLEKLTVQETRFVELIGNKLAGDDNDRILFLITTELNKIVENKDAENLLTSKINNTSNLAFSIWADSKLSSENFNSSVLLLDTNYNLVTDFNINYNSLNVDSVINFIKKSSRLSKYGSVSPVKDTIASADSVYSEEPDYNGTTLEEFVRSSEDDSSKIKNKFSVFKNTENKYYSGIVTLEKIDLRNTEFAKKTGYAVVTVQYEPKNLLVQSSFQIFKNYTKDNLFDKLISTPVITEYIDDEFVSSTDPEISKGNTKSIESFKDFVRNKDNKSVWRYETFNNEKYRTFYTLVNTPDDYEKIYSISIKRNDAYLILYFYLKFVLFIVMIYGLISFLYFLYYVASRNLIVFNFREKLLTSFIIVSVIPIILLAIYTRGYIKNKYDISFENQIKSDLNLIAESFKNNNQNFLNERIADSLKQKEKTILNKSLSRSDKNFNLYTGLKLFSTTNEELFKSDLLDNRIDGGAYYNLNYEKKDIYFKNLDLPGFSFYAGYTPILDKNNNVRAIISSQTVYRQNEINEELTESLTFIFGIYIIVIIILLLFITFFVERITRPISILKLATDKLSRGETNIEIKLDSKDEFGSLIDSFNRMTRELESSKEKLKKAEREAAWRDIARRVAHEIKNPLTPMKLSVQHLYDLYLRKKTDEEFEITLTKTKDIMLNEIDKLNKIATEFSNFAKLPQRKYEKVNINDVIYDVISLYEKFPGITFDISLKDNLSEVTGDKQEMNRVFQNIIKNAVQSIDKEGWVKIITSEDKSFVNVVIEDNGEGMDNDIMQKLFEPNFSTKSSGMGLGLSITKKSLDNMNANIDYESAKGKGTKVRINFSKTFRENS